MSTKENPQVGASEIHVYAGTAGHSAWFSDDLGMTWVHPNSHSGMYLEARVWALSTHSALPESLHAGTDEGVFGWSEHSARWEHLSRMLNDVWAVLHDPRDPSILYAGTRPAGLYRSTDGGRVWTELAAPGIAKFSNVNMGPTRVTQLLADPFVPDRLWATVEIGGIYRSDDRGSSWRLMADGLVSADVHGIAVTRTKSGAPRVLATTNRGLHVSDDHGEHWRFSLLWCIATHPSNPLLLFVCTNLGQIFRSTDGGDTWIRLPHEFGEVRALLWRALPPGTRRAAHSLTRAVAPKALST